MRVSAIQIIDMADACQLQARIESDRPPEDGNRFAPFTLWFRFPAWCRPFLNPGNGDPFLAALLVPAMMSGERLAISSPVSARLLRSLPDLQAIYHSFDSRLQLIEVETTSRPPLAVDSSPPAVGLFLSLGVDSYYSLLKNLRDHSDDDQSVSHLVMINGFDVSHDGWDERFSPRMLNAGQRVARETGKTLLPVTTNLRPVTRALSRWNLSHGSALASVALALDGLFTRVLIAAGTTYDQLYPWGSHPVLDPHWSTDRMTVVHDGCEMGRIDKIGVVAQSPLVLDTLKVCPFYNCGTCIKCLPTIIDLMQIGALEACSTLPHTVDVDRLREIFRAYKGQLNVENYQRRLANFDGVDTPPGLREALAELIASETMPATPPRHAGAGWAASFRSFLARSSGAA